MGTHPIFESDFDCLTECRIMGNAVGSYTSVCFLLGGRSVCR